MPTVFVSSTFQDLKTERKAVWEVLGTLDVLVRGMEQFGARPAAPLETCLVEVDQSDIYVGLVGFRLGSVESQSGKSFTQLEYERAVQTSKQVLIYLIDEENALVPHKFIDKGEGREKLEAFKKKLREKHTVETFVNAKDLAEKLGRDLRTRVPQKASSAMPQDELSASKHLLEQYRLLPLTVAGKEALLHMEVRGDPYPASKAVCEAFNLTFGATIGIPITVTQPSVASVDLSNVFVDERLAQDLSSIKKGDQLEAYVRLHFSEAPLETLRARFTSFTDFAGLSQSFARSALGEVKEYLADSALAGQVSRVVSVVKSAKAS